MTYRGQTSPNVGTSGGTAFSATIGGNVNNGATAVFTTDANGNAIGLANPNGGSAVAGLLTPAAAAAAQAVFNATGGFSGNSPQTMRVLNGVVDMSGRAPKVSRWLATMPKETPAMLFEPANLGLPTATNCTAAVATNYICRSQYGGVSMTSTVTTSSGNYNVAWTGLSINFGAQVAAGYTAGVMYVCLPHRTESIALRFDNGIRSRTLTFAAPVGRTGWVALPFALPGLSAGMQASVNNALVQQNSSGFGESNGGFDSGFSTVTAITLTISTFGAAGTNIVTGDVTVVAGMEVLPKLKPAVMLTYDKINGSASNGTFFEVVDKHIARGLKAGVRYHGLYDNNSSSMAYINYAVAAGFEVYNGQLTRVPTTGQTVNDAWREFGVNQSQARGNGLQMSPFYSTAGNATWPDGTYETLLPQLGIRYGRTSGLNCAAHGFGGVLNPLSMGVAGMEGPLGPSGVITPTQWLQALVDAGVHGSAFSHGFWRGGVNPADSRITEAQLDTFLIAAQQFQSAGLVDFVGPTGMANVLDGLA